MKRAMVCLCVFLLCLTGAACAIDLIKEEKGLWMVQVVVDL